MHILFLTDNFPPESNAPAIRTHEHAREWVRAGHRVTVITCAPNFPEGRVYPGYTNAWYRRETLDGIAVVRVKTYITANEGFARRILDYISFGAMGALAGLWQRRPDVIVSTSPQFFCACGAWVLSVLRWKPWVFELRDIWPASIAAVGAMHQPKVIGLLEQLELFLYRRASRIVSVTDSFRTNLASRGIDSGKIDTVRNGVDLERFRPTGGKDPGLAQRYGLAGKFVVGYIGTHGMAHALDRVLESAALLRHRDDIRFLFAGGGAERAALEALVQQLKLTNVIMLPRQPREAMPAVWSLCDVSLVSLRDSPLFAEVIPSKIFESMAMGLPMIVSCPPGEATALVAADHAGVSVAPEDGAALARAVSELHADPQRLAGYARASASAAAQYDRRRQARLMLDSLATAAG